MEKQNEKSEVVDVLALIKRTDKENPKPEDLTAIKKHLDEDNLLVKLNTIGKRAFSRAVETCTNSALMQEVYRRDIEEKRKELGIEFAMPIEKILIDQVVLCWFRLNQIEMIHASKQAESHTLENGIYWDKKLNSAQRRLLKAMETLAKVQKHLSEAKLRDEQANLSRKKGTVLATKLLKDLTK